MKERTAFEIIKDLDSQHSRDNPYRTYSFSNTEQLALIVLKPLLGIIGARIGLVIQEVMKTYEEKK